MEQGSNNLRGKAEIPPCESNPATTISFSTSGTKRKQQVFTNSDDTPHDPQSDAELASAPSRSAARKMADQPVNELLSAQKSSDSGLQVALHPLPLLEISDYITRGYQRGFKGAVVGALLGQQNGREITIEQSFTCKSAKNAKGLYELDEPWFVARLEQSEFPTLARHAPFAVWLTAIAPPQ
jgi:hypothetical protein